MHLCSLPIIRPCSLAPSLGRLPVSRRRIFARPIKARIAPKNRTKRLLWMNEWPFSRAGFRPIRPASENQHCSKPVASGRTWHSGNLVKCIDNRICKHDVYLGSSGNRKTLPVRRPDVTGNRAKCREAKLRVV